MYTYVMDDYIFNEKELRIRWENVHMAGRKRFQVQISSTRNLLVSEDINEWLREKETDDFEEALALVKETFDRIIETQPLILYDCPKYEELRKKIFISLITLAIAILPLV